MTATIRVMNLTKKFGELTAVDNISFEAAKGVVGFLGPNGAGKSTTMKMLTGFLAPTSGTAYIGGYDINEQSLQAKKIFGYLAEGAPIYPDMRVREFLRFIADIRGLTKHQQDKQLTTIINKLNLQSVLHQTIESLSKGFKRRVGLAQALIHDPSVLILDEPTDGLDPNQKREIRNLIKELGKEKAIIISTHILEEVEAVCDRVIVISAGKIILDSTPKELAAEAPEIGTINILEKIFVKITNEYNHVS